MPLNIPPPLVPYQIHRRLPIVPYQSGSPCSLSMGFRVPVVPYQLHRPVPVVPYQSSGWGLAGVIFPMK